MKKVLFTLITLALCAAISITAFAANPITAVTAGSNSDSADVKGTYVAGASSDTIYSVSIVWGSMEFTYTAGDEGTWNPATHAYDGETTGAWACDADANKIAVTNHSNTAIDAILSYTSEAEYAAIAGTFTEESGTANDNELELVSAVGTTVANAPKASATLNLSGEIASDVSNVKIGTITVTISDAE